MTDAKWIKLTLETASSDSDLFVYTRLKNIKAIQPITLSISSNRVGSILFLDSQVYHVKESPEEIFDLAGVSFYNVKKG